MLQGRQCISIAMLVGDGQACQQDAIIVSKNYDSKVYPVHTTIQVCNRMQGQIHVQLKLAEGLPEMLVHLAAGFAGRSDYLAQVLTPLSSAG